MNPGFIANAGSFFQFVKNLGRKNGSSANGKKRKVDSGSEDFDRVINEGDKAPGTIKKAYEWLNKNLVAGIVALEAADYIIDSDLFEGVTTADETSSLGVVLAKRGIDIYSKAQKELIHRSSDGESGAMLGVAISKMVESAELINTLYVPIDKCVEILNRNAFSREDIIELSMAFRAIDADMHEAHMKFKSLGLVPESRDKWLNY